MQEEYAVIPAVPRGKTVRVPGSKSITLRAIAAAAMAEGESVITAALECDDTRYFADAVRSLGIKIELSAGGTEIRVEGQGCTWPEKEAELFLGDCGTGYRFMAAMAALGEGPYKIRGSKRLEARPMKPLVEALKTLGAEVEHGGGAGPIAIRRGNIRGGRLNIRGDVSSQFVSALLLIGPRLDGGIEIAIEGEPVSLPYIEVTIQVLEEFGINVECDGAGILRINGAAAYRPCELAVEPDASSACYWFAAAAITGGTVTVPGIPPDSVQADLKFLDLLSQMGCRVERSGDGITVRGGELCGITADMRDFPDAAPALAVVAAFAGSPTEIVNIGGLRHKESDRISAIAEELRRAGIEVREFDDALAIVTRTPVPAVFEPHGDHRIAMSMALMGLVVPGVSIKNPEVVAKSYPGFWEDLEKLGDKRSVS